MSNPARRRTDMVEEPAVLVLNLCESRALVLRPGQLYRFEVDPNCPRCCELAVEGMAP